ncbi:SDR family NAD(P)-dependent oxidoreductase [Pseudomonas chlororaphis]|uniref:SDR family NAD(P)-dependent oxidoreductase n=1 Tax=Pseudomonas chlororaphis TaxID=587753 RepID=UPI0023665633|nr:SDR family oxidoreductase [Pseudomonas chlororaphis]WDH19951.1 SDR family oxidoreductase [Pseudomonas chlororaphis]
MSKKDHNKGTALITGASSGIGATYANRLAQRGYDLLLIARDLPRLEAMAEHLEQTYGVKVEILRADLTNKVDLLKVEHRLRSDPAIGLLINNAGMAMKGTLAEADLETVDTLIQLNVVALTRLSSAAADNFVSAGRGAIINLASVVALAPEMFNAVYSASKAYVLSLTQTLQGEIGKLGVQVQAVLPGVTRTEIWERSGVDESLLPPEMIMEVGEMVDASLAGFDQGELITIPSLPDAADWQALVSARANMGPNLSHKRAAQRYK